jgi:hypothetical protein
MTTAELLLQIKDILKTDQELTSWSLKTFGRQHTVFIDIDEENPPDPAEDYPIIAITSIRQVRGGSLREISREIELGVGIIQEEILTEDNSRIMTGMLQVQSLLEYSENALYRAHIADVADVSAKGETSYISRYPLFVSGSVLTVKTLKTNRHGLP